MLRSAGSRYVVGCACAVALFIAPNPAAADKFVSGYIKSNGTVVGDYMRSDRDGVFSNNFSTKPNINPYTGKMGTRVTPPNYSTPSYSISPSYLNLPATPVAPRSPIVTTPYFGSASIPSVDDRQAADAARAAQIAAAAKAYNDAKAQALATARANSDQRRKVFRVALDTERAKAGREFEARKAEIVAEHTQREPAAIEADKAELRTSYRELIDQFDRGQAAQDQQFKSAIASKRERLSNYYDDRQAIAAELERGRTRPKGEPTLAMLLRDEQRENEQKLESKIVGWTDRFAKTAASDRVEFVATTTDSVRGELAKRSERRQNSLDQRLLAMKAANDQELGQRIAKLESDFERAEGERFAADQERAERRFLAYVHGDSIDSAIVAAPVAFHRPTSATPPSANSAALTITFVAGLGLLLAVGAILSARSKPIDFRHTPPGKRC